MSPHDVNIQSIFQETQVNELTYGYLLEFNLPKYFVSVFAGPDGFASCLLSACTVR